MHEASGAGDIIKEPFSPCTVNDGPPGSGARARLLPSLVLALIITLIIVSIIAVVMIASQGGCQQDTTSGPDTSTVSMAHDSTCRLLRT
ncbi:hypothetical protein ZHAS_00013960 [Anopheles sinensis]|uniref:Uncharacterized protein n=1 Tax=Anopheles sinensis TaxID=74873 RepID=A0A084W700_ANOSI|nr:hypothetical protein ZHAS_00013960 [Anopheles sinensis]